MKIFKRMEALAALLLCCTALMAQQQGEEKELSLEERCEIEADRLQGALNLEDWQTYYVDSILKHDYAKMQEEYDKLMKEKVSSYNIYQSVQDRWLENIDAAFRRLFTDEQWAAYLKQGAARQQKAREKRRVKAQKNLLSGK